jgi:hypothetical protein
VRKVFKKVFEVVLIAVITSAVAAGAASSYRLLSDVQNLVVQYTNGVITDLVDSRGQLVGLITSTNNQSMNTIGLTNGAMLCNSTAPTIASGFGASAVIANSNGSCTFQINVGATSVASSGVIALPAAKTGWNCFAMPATASMPQVSATMLVGPTSTTSVTIANFTDDSGANLNWVNNEVLAVSCAGY